MASDEVISDGCEMLLRDSKALEKLAMKNASLYLKVGEKLKNLIRRIRNSLKGMYSDVDSLHPETAELMKALGDRINEFQQMYDRVLYDSITNMRGALAEAENAKTRENLDVLEKQAEKEGLQLQSDQYLSISFSEEQNNETKYILQSIVDNIAKIPAKIVFTVNGVELQGRATDYVKSVFDEQGNVAHNSVLGDVELGASGAKSTMFHGYGANKLAAVRAIKPTIENGEIISKAENYQNTGVDRYIIAAMGNINGKESYVGAMIKSYPNAKRNSKFYLHEATIIETDPHIMTAVLKSSDTVSESASKQSIFNTEQNVNSKLQNSEELSERDAEYLKLAKDPKKNAAQLRKIVDAAAEAAGLNSPMLYHGTKNAGFTGFDLSKMDDGRSIFLTSSPAVASTYSGVTGTRSIADMGKVKNIEAMPASELVERLNAYSEQNGDNDEGIYNYEIYDLKKKEQLTRDVAKGKQQLAKTVEKLVKKYADRLSEDFDDKTAATHRQLAALSDKLSSGNVSDLSTPIYMLLHHTDAFEGETGIAELEKNIRLADKLDRAKIPSKGVIVKEGLDGYDLQVLSTEQARNELSAAEKTGNYALYAKLGKSLTVDAKGDNWNALDFRIPGSKYEIEEEDGRYKIINKSTRTVEWADGKMSWDSRAEAQKIIDGFTDKNEWAKRLDNTRKIAEYAKSQGYDSVIFKNLRDNGGMNSQVSTDTSRDTLVSDEAYTAADWRRDAAEAMEFVAKTDTEKAFALMYADAVRATTEAEAEINEINAKLREAKKPGAPTELLENIGRLTEQKKQALERNKEAGEKLLVYQKYGTGTYTKLMARAEKTNMLQESVTSPMYQSYAARRRDAAEAEARRALLTSITKRSNRIIGLASDNSRTKHIPTTQKELIGRLGLGTEINTLTRTALLAD